MPLNPKAEEFQPRWSTSRTLGLETDSGFGIGFKSKSIAIPLPEDPFSQECDDIALSPEEADELENVQDWVELMADFEEQEGDHLIALGLKRSSDKRRIHDLKHRS